MRNVIITQANTSRVNACRYDALQLMFMLGSDMRHVQHVHAEATHNKAKPCEYNDSPMCITQMKVRISKRMHMHGYNMRAMTYNIYTDISAQTRDILHASAKYSRKAGETV